MFAEGGSDDSDHEREWEKQQLLKAGANAKVCVCMLLYICCVVYVDLDTEMNGFICLVYL